MTTSERRRRAYNAKRRRLYAKQQRSLKRQGNPVLRQVDTVRGMAARIAEACGITREAVWDWQKVPAAHVLTLEQFLGIPRHLIRPDLYQRPSHPRTRRWLTNGRRKNGEGSGRTDEFI